MIVVKVQLMQLILIVKYIMVLTFQTLMKFMKFLKIMISQKVENYLELSKYLKTDLKILKKDYKQT